MMRFGPGAWGLLVVVAIVTAGGCVEERVVARHGWAGLGQEEAPDQAGQRGDKASLGSSARSGKGGWAIAVVGIDGPDHEQLAEQQRVRLVNQTRVSGWWVQDEGARSVIYFGRYETPQDKAARSDLMALQQMAARGVLPQTPLLVPVATDLGQPDSPYDLRSADRGEAEFTLQVGFYDEQFGPDFRKAAQQAVEVLRQEGAEAYYYHGPNQTLITVGLFGPNAVSPTGTYSPQVQTLQQQYPYNLGNGRILYQTGSQGKRTELASFLVRLPGSRP